MVKPLSFPTLREYLWCIHEEWFSFDLEKTFSAGTMRKSMIRYWLCVGNINHPVVIYWYIRAHLNQYSDYIFKFLLKRASIQVPPSLISNQAGQWPRSTAFLGALGVSSPRAHHESCWLESLFLAQGGLIIISTFVFEMDMLYVKGIIAMLHN